MVCRAAEQSARDQRVVESARLARDAHRAEETKRKELQRKLEAESKALVKISTTHAELVVEKAQLEERAAAAEAEAAQLKRATDRAARCHL